MDQHPVVPAPSPYWVQRIDEVAGALGTDPVRGLTDAEAEARLARHGPNALDEREAASPWLLLARQFTNTMIAVLAVAGIVTFIIGERLDTIVIASIVVLNGIVGFVQEYRAERSLEALGKLTASVARVVRDGAVVQIDAVSLVPGDLVQLSAGDVVPADLRLITVASTRVDEAVLTGESEAVAKVIDPLVGDEDAAIGDRRNMAFKGTAVSAGRADGLVVATGTETELGRIAGLLGTRRQHGTPLERRLTVLGRRLASAAVVVCGLVFVVGVARGEPAETMFLTAVSLAVAAVPEGLPAVVTVTLALGARRMADRHALIRRLSAVETLGSVTVICSDKTGTLTENSMTVEAAWTMSGTYLVQGDGYAPTGHVSGGSVLQDTAIDALIRVAALCNDAELVHEPGTDAWRLVGDPTEGALLALAARLGGDREALLREHPRCDELPFEADRKRMSTVHEGPDGRWLATKGAFEAVAPLLIDSEVAVQGAEVEADQYARQGYRVLALAHRRLDDADIGNAELSWERDLELAGIVAIADPPRQSAAEAVARCRGAGITPVMITGDHPRTAVAIGRRLGILDPEDDAVDDDGNGDDDAVLTGPEVEALGDDELAERVAGIRVFARTSPEQKLRIVEAWRTQGAVVAMTGDGVNDAPALRHADIGVAMGITGTDVSQQASDMVLADDNFATIVGAVEEGRHIYDNIRRFVRYLLTTNSGEIWVMLLAIVLGLPVPLTAAQILWINLVTDGLPAIALGLEPAEDGLMDRPPRRSSESILGAGLWQQALGVGLLMAAVTLPLMVYARAVDWPWQTMAFMTVSLLQLGNALATRSESKSLRRLGLRTNPWLLAAVLLGVGMQLCVLYLPPLQTAFDTEALDATQLFVVAVVSTSAFVAVELDKVRRRRSTTR